jgi:hypothetical protein
MGLCAIQQIALETIIARAQRSGHSAVAAEPAKFAGFSASCG